MKLLFITSTPLNPIQGSGTYVGIATLKTALERLGHTVEILAPDFWAPNFLLRRYLFNLFLPSRIHPTLSPKGGEGKACPERTCPEPFDIAQGKLRRRSRRSEGDSWDVIIGFDCDGYQLKGLPIPYVVSLKGVLADEAKQERGFIRRLLELQAKWERQNVGRAQRVLVTSRYCRKVVEENYRVDSEKISVVPELIDLEAWGELFKRGKPVFLGESHQKKGIAVLSVCRMYPRKNLETLLHAWVLVKAKEPKATLRIVGTGQEYRRWLGLSRKLGLRDSVFFLGNRSREELAEEYKHCDLFCLPSRQEGFGIVFLEAMAAGKPIVAAGVSAVPEVVREGREGLLVPPDDARGLAGRLLELIQDPLLRSRIGKSAGERVRQYDALEVARQFLNRLSFS